MVHNVSTGDGQPTIDLELQHQAQDKKYTETAESAPTIM